MIRYGVVGGVASPVPAPFAIASFQPASFTALTTVSTVASPAFPTDNMPPFAEPNIPELSTAKDVNLLST